MCLFVYLFIYLFIVYLTTLTTPHNGGTGSTVQGGVLAPFWGFGI
jgi:hypothetical protein